MPQMLDRRTRSRLESDRRRTGPDFQRHLHLTRSARGSNRQRKPPGMSSFALALAKRPGSSPLRIVVSSANVRVHAIGRFTLASRCSVIPLLVGPTLGQLKRYYDKRCSLRSKPLIDRALRRRRGARPALAKQRNWIRDAVQTPSKSRMAAHSVALPRALCVVPDYVESVDPTAGRAPPVGLMPLRHST